MVPKCVVLEPLREGRRWDLGFPILCFLFVISRGLDVCSTISIHTVFGREAFNPINNLFVRLILNLPFDWLDCEMNPLNATIIYQFGIPGLLVFQLTLTVIMLVGLVVVWKLSGQLRGWEARWARRLTKIVAAVLTVGSAGAAILNQTWLLTYSL